MSETSSEKIKKLLNSSDRSSQKKYCETILVNKKAVSINTVQLYIEINVNKKRENTMIDFNMIENFITKEYAENKRYSI